MRMIRRDLCVSASLGALLMASPFGGAMAQTGGSATSGGSAVGLEDIVVTARKRAENVQSTPVAVSAISSEMLERNRLVRIDDLQKSVPGLVIYSNPSLVGAATFTLRGFTASDYIPTNDSPVAVYLDGVYLARPFGALFNLTDLERVEVLRGPQGTLNGRNATAGSIALYTKGPADTFGVQQRLSYGSFNDFMTRTMIDTGQIGDTGLSFRGAYMHHQSDDYVKNRLAKHGPGYLNANSLFLAARGEWGDFTADYKLDYTKEKGLGAQSQVVASSANFLNFFQTYNPGFQLQPGFRRTLTYKPAPASTQRTTGHSLTLNLDVAAELQIKSITGIRSLRTGYRTTSGAYPQLFGNVSRTGAPPYTIQPIDLSSIDVLITQRQFSQEVQFTGEFARLSYATGLYYFRERALQSYSALQTPGSVSTLVLSPTTGRYGAFGLLDFVNRAQSKALYGQVSYTPPILGDRLELTAGTRYTKDRKHLIQTNPAPGTATVPIPRDVSRSFSDVSSEGSVKMQWTPSVMTYFRVAQAYKSGGFSARDTSFAPNGYRPETEISYELGVKADLFDRHVRLNADIFRTKYKDLQIFQTFAGTLANACSTATCSTVINAGSARYDGVEAELTVIPVRGFELKGNIGYLDPKYDKFLINPTTDIAKSPTVRFAYLAKVTAGASAEYSFEPSPIGELSMRVNWSYHSTRYFTSQSLPTNFAEQTRDPGFHDVGAQINLANIPVPGLEAFSVAVYGANLLNKHQILQGVDLGTFGTVAYGPGRSLGISLTAKY
jgi:iron complex outermembrane receptor protein